MGTQLPSPKGAQPPIFGPYLLWLNVWMHQDATWYGGTPQPRRPCVRWGPSSPPQKKGTFPQFSAHVCCCQTAVCIRIPLGAEVGLSLGVIVLDGDPAPPPLKGTAPNFRPCPLWPMVGWTKMPLGVEVGLGPGNFV